MFFRLFLIVAFIPLQSCSNTLIGEKLENSFDATAIQLDSVNMTKSKQQKKLKEIKIIPTTKINENEENKDINGNNKKRNLISNQNRYSKKPSNLIKKAIFNPQPYRIILKLSGTNPSAPAETVTQALRKAGVQFEVEKIERFDEGNLLNGSSLKRNEF